MVTFFKITLCFLFGALITACQSNTTKSTSSKIIGKWEIVSISNTNRIKRQTLTFNKENKVVGTSPCNNYSSNYLIENHTINFGAIMTTRKMCQPALMALESSLLSSINKITHFTIKNDVLTLLNDQGGIELIANRSH